MNRVLGYIHAVPALRACVAVASLVSAPVVCVTASPLSDLVAAMQPGEWRELATSNINQTLTASGASGIVFGYTDKIVWDPTSRRLFFIGGDHNDAPQFVSYSESTNSWQRLTRPAWMGGGTMHGYNHTAIDSQARVLYHRPFNVNAIYRYQIDTDTWDSIPSVPTSVLDIINCCIALEWFPELHALVYAAGTVNTVVKWDQPSNQWSRLTATATMGQYHTIGDYNPVQKIVLFGGGNGSRNLYKLNAAGQITALKAAPIDIGIEETIVTVDPVSGDYLVFNNAREFYVYRAQTDSWAQQTGGAALPIWTTQYQIPVHGAVATPLGNYGVNLFVTCDGANNCHVNLYKHEASTVDTRVPANPTSLQAG